MDILIRRGRKLSNNQEALTLAKRAEKWFLKKKFVSHKILFEDRPYIYCTDGEKIIGLLIYSFESTCVNVELIYVSSRYRRCGLMRKMMKKIPGTKKLLWGVHLYNTRAIRAYLKIGATLVLCADDNVLCTLSRK